MARREGVDALVIPGVDAYLDEFDEKFRSGALDLGAYESDMVRASACESGGEQLAFPVVDGEHPDLL